MSRISQSTIDELTRPSLTSRVLDTIAEPLNTAAKILDTPGSVLRGLLAGKGDRAFGGIFDPSKRVSGSELLGYPKDKFTWGGFGTEVLLDPLNLLGIGELTAGGKAALRASKLATKVKALESLGKFDEALGLKKTLAGLGDVTEYGKTFAEQGARGQRSLLSLSIPGLVNEPLLTTGIGGFTKANELLKAVPGVSKVGEALGKKFNPNYGLDDLDIEVKNIRRGMIRSKEAEGTQFLLEHDKFAKDIQKKYKIGKDKFNEFLHDAIELQGLDKNAASINPHLYDLIPKEIKDYAETVVKPLTDNLLVSAEEKGLTGVSRLGSKFGYDPRFITREAYQWLANKNNVTKQQSLFKILMGGDLSFANRRTIFRDLPFNELNDAFRKRFGVDFDFYSSDIGKNLANRIIQQGKREVDADTFNALIKLNGTERVAGETKDALRLISDKNQLLLNKFTFPVKDDYRSVAYLDDAGKFVGISSDQVPKVTKEIEKIVSKKVIEKQSLGRNATIEELKESILNKKSLAPKLVRESLLKATTPEEFFDIAEKLIKNPRRLESIFNLVDTKFAPISKSELLKRATRPEAQYISERSGIPLGRLHSLELLKDPQQLQRTELFDKLKPVSLGKADYNKTVEINPYRTKTNDIKDIRKSLHQAGFTKHYFNDKDFDIAERLMKTDQLPDFLKGVASFLDNVQGVYRMFLTTLVPAYHGRNAYSGAFMNALAGANPVHYATALRDLLGKRLSKDTIVKLKELGVLGRGLHTESLDFATGFKSVLQNPLSKAGLKTAEGIDNINRYALYLDRIKKGFTPREAADDVIKFHFDYSDITGFEKHVARRTLLFYTFFRKALPLMMESLAKNPKFMMAYARATGKTNANIVQPSWLPDAFFAGQDKEKNDIRVSLGLPFDELSKYGTDGKGVQRIWQLILTQFNPLLTGVIESASGQNLYFDRPLEGGTIERLLDLSPLSRFTGIVNRAREKPLDELIRSTTGVTVRRIPKDQKRLNNIANIKRELNDLVKSGQAKQFINIGNIRDQKLPEISTLNSLLSKLEKQ